MIFEDLAALNMKMAALWIVMPFSLVLYCVYFSDVK